MNAHDETGGARLRRIMLALDALNCETPLIEAAARIAAKLEAELDALFVEDDDVYTVADLPFAREISLSSAREHEISGKRVEQTLRGLSRDAEQRFGAVIRSRRLRGHFEVRRARRQDVLSDAALHVGLLLLQPRERTFVRLRVVDERPARVFVLCAATPASHRALELGARLAHADHGLLEVVVAGGLGAPLQGDLERTGLRLEVREHPPGAGVLAMLPDIDNRPGNTVLVAGDLSTADDRNLVLESLSRLRCHVLLVN